MRLAGWPQKHQRWEMYITLRLRNERHYFFLHFGSDSRNILSQQTCLVLSVVCVSNTCQAPLNSAITFGNNHIWGVFYFLCTRLYTICAYMYTPHAVLSFKLTCCRCFQYRDGIPLRWRSSWAGACGRRATARGTCPWRLCHRRAVPRGSSCACAQTHSKMSGITWSKIGLPYIEWNRSVYLVKYKLPK